MRPYIYEIVLSIACLLAVDFIFPFIVFLNAPELLLLFFILFVVANLPVERIRKFLVLPDIFFFSYLIRTLLVIVVTYITQAFIGGIRIAPYVMKPTTWGFITVQQFQFDVTGTIIVGSMLFAALYELLLYLKQ